MLGREEEKRVLLSLLESDKSEFVAIYGRRRVGKTYLVRETFNYKFAFQHTGLQGGTIHEQLEEFANSLIIAGMKKVKRPKSWSQAFFMLGQHLSTLPDKKVIFIDELPWLDTPNSKFVSALDHFWNGWATARKDIVLVVCGSATSWIMEKVVMNYGGLHNRLTEQIYLRPFTLHECEQYATQRNLGMSRRNVLETYMVLGGMPAVVFTFVTQKNYSGTLKMQKQLLLDYEEDITKYAHGLDKGKILDIYRKIPVFLGKDNKKFQISKVRAGARNRDYVGTVSWLDNAGIINVCYCMSSPELPLKGNYNPDNYKIYFRDTGLLIGSFDEEVQQDLRSNKNFNTYKGALYENIVADMLVKQGYNLYFYRNEKGTLEMDFFVRDSDSLIPVEVKANDSSTPSLNALIEKENYEDIKYGIKLANKNIGFNGKFYTIPYFLTFMLKRFLSEKGKTEE